MSKIILLVFAGFLAGVFIFSAPTASAAEMPANQTNISLASEEVVILQQSLVALTAVLIDLQTALAKSENLPPNTAQIITSLNNIGKSLAQISETMEKRVLAVSVPEVTVSQVPLVTIQKSDEAIVEKSNEAIVSESSLEESESQFETLLGESAAETESQKTLVASIGAIAGQRITWIVVVILAIGAVLFWKMRGGQEAVKTS